MTKADLPLSIYEQKFVRTFVKTRDLAKTSRLCDLTVASGRRLYRLARVRWDIDRRVAMIEREQTLLDAQEIGLTNGMLDQELRRTCMLNPETHGTLKLDALRLAYVVTGRLVDGALSIAKPGGTCESMSITYQQLIQSEHGFQSMPSTSTDSRSNPQEIEASADNDNSSARLVQSGKVWPY